MASKLYIGNLPHSTTDASLSEFVTNAGFSVASAVVIRDRMTGDPRGFGFVELADGEDGQGIEEVVDGPGGAAEEAVIAAVVPAMDGVAGGMITGDALMSPPTPILLVRTSEFSIQTKISTLVVSLNFGLPRVSNLRLCNLFCTGRVAIGIVGHFEDAPELGASLGLLF